MADMLQDMAKNLCDGQADAYAPDVAAPWTLPGSWPRCGENERSARHMPDLW